MEAQSNSCIVCNSLFKVMGKKKKYLQDNVISQHPTWWERREETLSCNSSEEEEELHQDRFDCERVRLERTLSKSSPLRRFSVMLLLSSNFGRMTAIYPSVDGCSDLTQEDKCTNVIISNKLHVQIQ